jgi:hypothetical protein
MSVAGTAGGRIAPGVGANLIGQHAHDRNQDATIYVGNLDPQVYLIIPIVAVFYACYKYGHLLWCAEQYCPVRRALLNRHGNFPLQVSEELVWELFTQAGPVGETTVTCTSASDHAPAMPLLLSAGGVPGCCPTASSVQLGAQLQHKKDGGRRAS